MKSTWNAFRDDSVEFGRLVAIELGHLLAHPRLWRFLLHPITRYTLAWLIALGGASAALYFSWISFDSNPTAASQRNDGNEGHTTIDFGGQYLMGRMLMKGYGKHLYHRDYQLLVLRDAFPIEDQNPTQPKSDADNFMSWFMGRDTSIEDRVGARLAPLAGADTFGATVLAVAENHVNQLDIGGPLYPPINAFIYSPLALMPPLPAYHVNQIVGVFLAFAAGLGIWYMSRGKIWWPVATAAIIGFPGYCSSLNLGQNAALTLTILIWGWALVVRNRPASGGIVWGLLAFKPVWAMSFFLVPFLMRRWRVCLAMVGTGVALAALTLPFVGLYSWREWLKVGEEATQTYKYDNNWIHCSRDLLSIPRRWLDFDDGNEKKPNLWIERRDDFPAAVVGWSLLIVVFELTIRLAILRRDQLKTDRSRGDDATPLIGSRAGFLLLASWLLCFHFMYYDVLLAALPVFLLFIDWHRYLRPRLVAIVPLTGSQLPDNLLEYYQPRFRRLRALLQPRFPVMALQTGLRHVWVVNSMTMTLVGLFLVVCYVYPTVCLYIHRFPYDTITLLALWLWCGWLWLRVPVRRPRTTASFWEKDDQHLRLDGFHAPQGVQLGADVGSPH
jgi:hypothetical protein